MPSLILNNQKTLEYKIRTSRLSKCLRLNVYRDGRVLITKPRYISLKRAQLFVQEKIDWLSEKISISTEIVNSNIKNRQNYLDDREKARLLVSNRLEYFNQFYNFKYKRVSIRNQSTRWGSCSRRANLNFNYRILELTPPLQDYLIVHELCHLKELNHSANFWDLVAKIIPDYKLRRRELRNISL